MICFVQSHPPEYVTGTSSFWHNFAYCTRGRCCIWGILPSLWTATFPWLSQKPSAWTEGLFWQHLFQVHKPWKDAPQITEGPRSESCWLMHRKWEMFHQVLLSLAGTHRNVVMESFTTVPKSLASYYSNLRSIYESVPEGAPTTFFEKQKSTA